MSDLEYSAMSQEQLLHVVQDLELRIAELELALDFAEQELAALQEMVS